MPTPSLINAGAYMVHVFTATGAALGLSALVAAVAQRWTLVFWLLGVALFVDGIDGTIAHKVRVADVLPRWSGDVLDLVVDFVTYVFVPAYVIGASGLLPQPLALPAGLLIVVTGALYFSDRDMKTPDNYFRGFPTLWNAVAFYLFVLRPAPWLAAAAIAILSVLTFVPFKFVHPFRVARLRVLTIAALALWCVLAAVVLLRDFEAGPLVAGGLVIIGLYFIALGTIEQRIGHDRPAA